MRAEARCVAGVVTSGRVVDLDHGAKPQWLSKVLPKVLKSVVGGDGAGAMVEPCGPRMCHHGG